MLQGISFYTAFLDIKNVGVAYLFRGLMAPLLQKTSASTLMFGVYAEVRRPLVERGVDHETAKLLAGIASGVVETIVMPFERLQTLLSDKKYDSYYKNTYQAFRMIGKYGVREYYRGYQATLLRNVSNVPYFFFKDKVRFLPEENEYYKSMNDFLAGGLIGSINSVVFYPVNVSRVAVQSKVGEGIENPFRVLFRVYTERGSKVRNIYRGALANSARCFLSWGVVTVAFENCITLLYSR